MDNRKIIINQAAAFDTFDVLIDLLRNKRDPFDTATRPQDPQFLPENLELKSLHHALYLFYVCLYMRGRITSQQAFDAFKVLYLEHPELFDPELIQSDPIYYYEKLCEHLKKGHLAFSVTDNARFWVENSRELYCYWEGDPRNFFNCLTSDNRETPEAYELICNNIIRRKIRIKDWSNVSMLQRKYGEPYETRGMYGFQKKMVSMISYFFGDAGLIPSFLFPSPIDYHVSRLLIMQNIIEIDNIKEGIATPKILSYCRDITSLYCQEKKVSAVELSDVLWLYSQLMCNHNPNRTRFRKGVSDGRNTPINIADSIKWTKNNENKYFDFCYHCAIKPTCIGYISEMPYYIKGELKLVDRQIPIKEPLFNLPKRDKKEKVEIKRKNPILESVSPSLFPEATLFDNQI